MSGEDRLPVDDGIPQQPLIAAIQIAVQRVEIEGDDVTCACAQVEDGRVPDEIIFTPGLAADYERLSLRSPHSSTTPLGSSGPSRQVLQ